MVVTKSYANSLVVSIKLILIVVPIDISNSVVVPWLSHGIIELGNSMHRIKIFLNVIFCSSLVRRPVHRIIFIEDR